MYTSSDNEDGSGLGAGLGWLHKVLTWWGDGGGQLQLHSSDGIQKLSVKDLQL